MRKIVLIILISTFIFSIGNVKAKTLDDSQEFEIVKSWYDKVVSFLNNIFSRAKQEIENRMKQTLEQKFEEIKNKILEAIF